MKNTTTLPATPSHQLRHGDYMPRLLFPPPLAHQQRISLFGDYITAFLDFLMRLKRYDNIDILASLLYDVTFKRYTGIIFKSDKKCKYFCRNYIF